MYDKQLSKKNKVGIDILLKQNFSMREVGRRLGVSHSTISRYKLNYYKKRRNKSSVSVMMRYSTEYE